MNIFKTGLSITTFALFYISCTSEVTTPEVPEEVVVVEKKEFEIDTTQVIWGDEFSENGALNSDKWGFDIGGSGWGNNESQFYTDRLENARVEDGNLVIEAKKETYQGSQYTSARVVSKDKGDFTYGRFEIRAKLPTGVGTWPAIWMLATKTKYGTQYWPDNGEIDIMEHVGFDQDVVHANIHTQAFNHSIGTNKGGKMNVPGAAEEFHVYAVNWLPESLVFEIDGVAYFGFPKDNGFNWPQWPFDQDFHLLMNIAVGGSWGGLQGIDREAFPQKMVIDYVRVYGIKEK